MQQLTLNFEGFADSRQPIDAGTAKQCSDLRDTAARIGRAVISSAMSRNLVAHGITARLTARARQTVSPWLALWQQWAARRSEAFTALCSTEEGEVFTRGDVVKAHLALALVLILIGVGGAL